MKALGGDPHANGKANGIIAQALFQRLRKR